MDDGWLDDADDVGMSTTMTKTWELDAYVRVRPVQPRERGGVASVMTLIRESTPKRRLETM